MKSVMLFPFMICPESFCAARRIPMVYSGYAGKYVEVNRIFVAAGMLDAEPLNI